MKTILSLLAIGLLTSCETQSCEKTPCIIINGHTYIHAGHNSTVHDPDCPKCKAALQGEK